MKEIELKVNVERTDELFTFLNKHAVFKGESNQHDEYFTPPHKDFTAVHPVQEWLRIRTEDGRSSVNYKFFHFKDGLGTYCDEEESEIESAETLRSIFLSLGFRSLTIVEKHRRTWHYKDFEIAVDRVKGLGDFVEVEYKGNESVEFEAAIKSMTAFLKEHGCGTLRWNRNGYPFLMLFPEKAVYQNL